MLQLITQKASETRNGLTVSIYLHLQTLPSTTPFIRSGDDSIAVYGGSPERGEIFTGGMF